MTPSSSPSSSTGSPPDSSPADTTFSDNSTTTTNRPSFVPLTLQPFSQHSHSLSSSLSSAASQSSRSLVQPPSHEHSTPPSAGPSRQSIQYDARAHTHGKQQRQYSRDSPILEDLDSMMSPSAGTNPASEEEDSHLDLEHELDNVHGSGGGGQTSTSPQTSTGKKKRTRTLTTPYQSAVLHALLAQSRFPTTAMREEVGRSIGLSARKVQNQRQKARKPRTQGQGQERAGSLLDSPQSQTQFGPFNPITGGGSISSNTPMAASSSSTADLMTRTSTGSVLYNASDDLLTAVSRSSSDSIMRGLPIPAPTAQVGSGGGISTESEFHLGYTTGSGGGGDGSNSSSTQVKIEGSSPEPPPTRFIKVSASPPHPPPPPLPPTSSSSSQHPYYTLLPTSSSRGRSLNPPPPPPPSRFPFTVGGDAFSTDTPVILPPLRLGGSPNMYQRTSTVTRHDPQLRYSASFPSFPQEMSAGIRSPPPPPPSSSGSSSSSSSSRSVLPPPFTLQPRPQWDWDRPLGVVLPSIGQMTGSGSTSNPGGSSGSGSGSGFRHFSSFHPQPQPRPRTSSDPTLPFLEQRHSALLTQPWPLPPPPTPRVEQHQGLVRYDTTRGGGDEKSSTSVPLPPSSLDSSKSRNRTPDMDCQPDRPPPPLLPPPIPPPSHSFVPLSRPVEHQRQEEDRMRYDSVTPKPSYFRG
ncbi:hypothetical protein Clacol_008684 [Clathrus columnatus]|uniref:Homeobox domain-containing protein n=1 Tax=Clathrus columnatus TaxID=1419009 RepID=A0AAV5ANK7_9AGAM|nr:hypothetical protein Clacol_008684 [Clathrus columnatus]